MKNTCAIPTFAPESVSVELGDALLLRLLRCENEPQQTLLLVPRPKPPASVATAIVACTQFYHVLAGYYFLAFVESIADIRFRYQGQLT